MEIGGRKMSVARKAPEQEEWNDTRPSDLWDIVQLVSWQIRNGTEWHAHVQPSVLAAQLSSAQAIVAVIGAHRTTITKTTASVLKSNFIAWQTTLFSG